MKIQEVLNKNDAHDTWALLRHENIVEFDELYDEIVEVSNNFSIDPDTVNPELFSDLFYTIKPFAISVTQRFNTGSKWHNKAIKILRYINTYQY